MWSSDIQESGVHRHPMPAFTGMVQTCLLRLSVRHRANAVTFPAGYQDCGRGPACSAGDGVDVRQCRAASDGLSAAC